MLSFRSEIENPVVEKDIVDLANKIQLFHEGNIDEEKFRSLRLAREITPFIAKLGKIKRAGWLLNTRATGSSALARRSLKLKLTLLVEYKPFRFIFLCCLITKRGIFI